MKKFLNSAKFKQYFRWGFLLFASFVVVLIFFSFSIDAFRNVCFVLQSFPDVSNDQFIEALGSSCIFGLAIGFFVYFLFMIFDFPHRYDYDTGRFLKQLLDRIDAIDHEEDPE